jgi:hypothetical protein
LIVTSPLLNEVLSVHHNHKKNKDKQQDVAFSTTTRKSNSAAGVAAKLGVTTNLVATLALLLGAEKYLPLPKQLTILSTSKLPIITLFFSTSASLFFFYRHKVK